MKLLQELLRLFESIYLCRNSCRVQLALMMESFVTTEEQHYNNNYRLFISKISFNIFIMLERVMLSLYDVINTNCFLVSFLKVRTEVEKPDFDSLNS